MKYFLNKRFNKNLINIYIKIIFKNKINQNKKIKNKNIITIKPQ